MERDTFIHEIRKIAERCGVRAVVTPVYETDCVTVVILEPRRAYMTFNRTKDSIDTVKSFIENK